MIAVDTKTREVWYGLNGKWFDKTGALDKTQPGAASYDAATLMDGDETTLYYPACSFRIGPTELHMRLASASQKYVAPSGFKAYGDP